jgi:hypothetical protein
MPKATTNYKGNVVIQRPYYSYKYLWIPYRFNKQVQIIKELDSNETFYIETYILEGTKEQFIDVYIPDDEKNEHIKKTYSYDANYDLYLNINGDKYLYLIEECVAGQK